MTSPSHQDLSTSLDGVWSAAIGDPERIRRVADPTVDEQGWAPTRVPGQWGADPRLADAETVLYRHEFTMDRPARQRRRWLSLDGVSYQGDVWMDGAYLGDTEGYFVQHVFEVTDQHRAEADHLVAVEVTCARQRDLDRKRNITGVLQDSNHLDPTWNPGGLWRGVRIEETGPVRIDALRVLVLEADADRAIVRVRATFDSAGNHRAIVRTLVDPEAQKPGTGVAALVEEEHVLAVGRNTLEWHLAIENPDRWWPHALGGQPLYDVRVEVELGQEISHARKRRVGLRTFGLRNWVASINGERLYLKGVNLAPPKLDLAAITAADHRLDLQLARDGELNTVRVHGFVAGPDLYREADRLGMLVWQDFPLQWGQLRGIRQQAERQAVAMVDQLGHHPSVVMWSCHNEPGAAEQRRYAPDTKRDPRTLLKRRAREQFPSWNRSILDRSVAQTLKAEDPSRPVNPHSGVAPHPPQLDGTDSHLWFGWRHGTVHDLAVEANRIGRRLRFVSEFGAQSVPLGGDPNLVDAITASGYPDLDESTLLELGAAPDRLIRYSPTHEHPTAEAWALATQHYQAWLVRRSVETLRRLKYRPNAGYCAFFLADSSPRVSESLLGHDRRPKLAWRALVEASRSVIVVCDLPEVELTRGTTTATLHVVNDGHDALTGLELTATWTTPGRGTPDEFHFTGSVDADSVSRVGRLRLQVPFGPGEGVLSLELRSPRAHAANTYRYRLTSPPDHPALGPGAEGTT